MEKVVMDNFVLLSLSSGKKKDGSAYSSVAVVELNRMFKRVEERVNFGEASFVQQFFGKSEIANIGNFTPGDVVQLTLGITGTKISLVSVDKVIAKSTWFTPVKQ